MGDELAATEISWLEVVKSAAHAKENDFPTDENISYCAGINSSWITQLNLSNDDSNTQGRSSDGLNVSFLRRQDITKIKESIVHSTGNEEYLLVKELKEIVKRSESLSKEGFLRLLGPYLLGLDATQKSTPVAGKLSEHLSNGLEEGTDEKLTLTLLKKCARLLGHRLVSVILEISILLNFCAPVQVLLERGVVVSNSCSTIVPSLVERQQALILCLYVANVPDLDPQDVYSMLTFFIDSVDKPSKPFQLVRKEWRGLAIAEIAKAGKHRASVKAAASDSGFHNLEKLVRRQDESVLSAVELAMAVDGFSSAELCIHYLVASDLDEAVLGSVVSQLSTLQVLKLMKYLVRWIERYSSHLAGCPVPRNRRVPSLPQILSLAGIVLESHFTRLVLSADFHHELRAMKSLVQSLVTLGISISPLGGITEHLKSDKVLPVAMGQVGSAPGYVIELLDMS